MAERANATIVELPASHVFARLRVPAGKECGHPGIQVRLARQLHVESLEPPGGLQQQDGRLRAGTGCPLDLSPKPLGSGALEVIGRDGFSFGHQAERGLEGTRVELRFGRREGSLDAPCRFGGQFR
jgi:hypothetical protein